MRYILAVLAVTILVSNARCEESVFKNTNFAFSMGSGIMRGYTAYQIGGHYEIPEGSGKVRFPLSELKFPLNLWFGSMGAKVELAEKVILEAKVKKGNSKNAGKTIDSDWGVWYEEIDDWSDPDSLDIYSESDTQTDILTTDISVRYYFNPWPYKTVAFSIFIGGKYTLQKFECILRDLDQWYPSLENHSGAALGHDYLSGKVMEYEVTQKIPSLITGVKIINAPRFGLDLMVGYSPFVKVEDEDRHILRSVVSQAKCKGDALLLSISGNFKFSTRWSLGLTYDYSTIETDGKEKQYVEGQQSATIDQKNFSDLHGFECMLGFQF